MYKLEEGVFSSKLTCDDGKRIIEIDARTSDAIALALRFKCPIYTTEEIMRKAGIILDFEKESNVSGPPEKPTTVKNIPVENKTLADELAKVNMAELQEMLNDAVKDEDYERASMIRDEIKRRKKE